MRMARRLTAALLVGSLACTAAACGGGTAQGDGERPKFGFLMYSSQQYASKFEQRGFEEAARRLGAEPIVQYAQADPEAQSDQVDQMITSGVSAVVITAVNGGTACSLVRKLQQADIKVIAEKFNIPDCEVDYLIQRDDHAVGLATAEHAVKQVPRGNYVIVSGDEATPVAQIDTEAYMEVLQPKIDTGDIKLVSQRFNANWSTDAALEQVEQALTANGNRIDAILANNDEMAMSALQAVRAQGLAGKVYISGQDADLANVRAMLDGEISYSSWTRWVDFGRLAAEAAHALTTGGPLPDGTEKVSNGDIEVDGKLMPVVDITPETLPEWLCGERFYPIEDVYKGIDGVEPPSC
jgi:D-xylose transport system substrate-binding protein